MPPPVAPADPPVTPASSSEDRPEDLAPSVELDPTPSVEGPVTNREDNRTKKKRGLHPAILFLVAVVAIAPRCPTGRLT